MARSLKSKRVSWAPDVNLCQVRLFLSEDAPAQSGLGSHDLQAKASWLLHSTVIGDDQPPPGFEGPRAVAPQISLVKWKCPPIFVLNPDWLVVAGEESKEAEIQKQRESRVLEAVYPRLSAIPPSPSDSVELQQYQHDDRQTPLIPIHPIEDDDTVDSLNSLPPFQASENLKFQSFPNSVMVTETINSLTNTSAGLNQLQGNASNIPTSNLSDKFGIGAIPGVEPDVVAAASAAFTAIMRSNEQGSLIDRDLLIKILSNPKLLEQLLSEHGTSASLQTALMPRPVACTSMSSISGHINRMESDVPLSTPTPIPGQFFPSTNTTLPPLNARPGPSVVHSQITTPTSVQAPPVKDINYYKSLIQQHGGDRNDVQDYTVVQLPNRHNQSSLGTKPEPVQSSKPRELKPKIQKPCAYFNSPSGCRHGANCMFQHEVSYQTRMGSVPETRSSKRIKLDRRELTGRS